MKTRGKKERRTLCEDGRRVFAVAKAGEVLPDLDAASELLLEQVVLVQEHCNAQIDARYAAAKME